MPNTQEIQINGVAAEGRSDFANKVKFIVDTIGTSLAAFTVGTDPSTVGRWAAGKNRPNKLDTERRIENTYRVLRFLLDDGTKAPQRSRHEIRAWLMGVNAHLDDLSPAEALLDGQYKDVMAAARAYSIGG